MQTKEGKVSEDNAVKPKGLGIRHLQAILYFVGSSINMANRTNLSMAIVAMTDKTSDLGAQTFEWNETVQGFLLSSFFWGGFIMQIPAGMLAHTFGAKLIFMISILGASTLNILVPFTAPYGWQYVCALRFIVGIFQGFCYPSMYTLMPKWIHPSERALVGFVVTAGQFGVFVMMLVSGQIAVSSLKWPGIFYVSGGIGIIWCIVWWILGSEEPKKFKGISIQEQEYLEEAFKNETKETIPIPWKSIFTSGAFISVILVHSANNFGFVMMIAEMPTYLNNILKFDIETNGILSAVPFIIYVIFGFLMGILSDFLINRKYVSRAFARKLFNSIGHWAAAIVLVILAYLPSGYPKLGAFLLILLIGLNGGVCAGFLINHMDLSPNFSGTLFGISNFFGNFVAVLAPMLTGFVVTDATNPVLWRIVFLITATFYFIGNLFFVLFGKATIQTWNSLSKNDDEELPEKEKMIRSQLSVYT